MIKKLIFSLSVFTLFSCSTNLDKKVNKFLEDYQNPNQPGYSLLIAKDGEILLAKSSGMASIEVKSKITNETNFRLASVTKQFTAFSILMLINEGKLSFETTLTEIFPKFPFYGKNITVKNLLEHTSGIVDYESLIPENQKDQLHDKDVLNMMMQIDSTYFSPGEKHQYSNSGYAVLAMIIEKITGKPYHVFLKERIFDPLKMETSVAFVKGENLVKNRAFGYKLENNEAVFADQNLTSAVLGDGGIYSNVYDMLKWESSLYTEKLLPKKLIDESQLRKTTTSGETFDYGYGWRLEKLDDYEVVYHTGSSTGFRNIIYRIPSERLVIIFLSNRDEGDTLVLARELAELYLSN